MTVNYEDMIEQIAQSVFATMLNIDLVRIELTALPERDLLLAAVHIVGEWTGSVVLALSQPVATSAAAAMLQVSADEVTENDRTDVAAELVNMVGGNLKSLLPGPSFLSLPTTVSGREFGVQVRDAESLYDVALASEYGPLQVRLFAKHAAAAIASAT
ncbi:MAG: chemotaxis protein CheX [Planctomycetia bacterium]|nr:chemotaxis protein CheX [Planctomycetia bacterium]